MLDDTQIDEYYKSLNAWFIHKSDKLLDMALNSNNTNVLVASSDKRILAVCNHASSVRALSDFDKQVVYSYVFDGMQGIQRNSFTRNKCWRMRVKDDGSGWNDSPNIQNTDELYSYILINQKAALMDIIHDELDIVRRLINRDSNGFQDVYFAKYLEAKYIIENNITEDKLLEYPLITGYADVCNISFVEAAKRILFKYETHIARLAENENLRMRYTDTVKREDKLENLQNILEKFKAEIIEYGNI